MPAADRHLVPARRRLARWMRIFACASACLGSACAPAGAQEAELPTRAATPAAPAASAAAVEKAVATPPSIVVGSCQFLDPHRPVQQADLRWVRLAYEVSAAGQLGKVELLTRSDDPALNARVMQTLRECRFVPGQLAGAPVAGQGMLATQVSVQEGDPAPGLKPKIVLTQACTPIYPLTARKAGVAGLVKLRFNLRADGRLQHVELIRSSGHPDLDLSALEALVRCPIRPGTDERGHWQGGAMLVEYSFSIK